MENYPLDSEKLYYSSDMLTLDCEDGPVTLSMTEWLHKDPVRIHRLIVKEKALQVDQMEVFAPLVSKLRRADYEYYRRITGLKMLIDFPGYGSEVEARIPYDTDPIAFYKWWRKGKNENKVYLSPAYLQQSTLDNLHLAIGGVHVPDCEIVQEGLIGTEHIHEEQLKALLPLPVGIIATLSRSMSLRCRIALHTPEELLISHMEGKVIEFLTGSTGEIGSSGGVSAESDLGTRGAIGPILCLPPDNHVSSGSGHGLLSLE